MKTLGLLSALFFSQLIVGQEFPPGLDVREEAADGFEACWITKTRQPFDSGWHREGSRVASETIRYFVKSKKDCGTLAEWIQSERPYSVRKKLSFSEAGNSAGMVSARTYTSWQFNDSLVFDSSGTVWGTTAKKKSAPRQYTPTNPSIDEKQLASVHRSK